MNDYNMNEFIQGKSSAEVEERQHAFLTRVFLWMAIALGFTGVVAMLTISSPLIRGIIFSSNLVFGGLIIAEFAIVWRLSLSLHKMSATSATLSLVLYSILNGLTLSVIFLVYTASSIASVFFIAGAMFGTMFLVGLVAKVDLTKLGGILMMALVGLIIASVVNIFMHNDAMTMMISYGGVLIFCGLTMYDAQKLKAIGMMEMQSDDQMQKYAIHGALRLYLDFINLFLFLLRILGRRK